MLKVWQAPFLPLGNSIIQPGQVPPRLRTLNTEQLLEAISIHPYFGLSLLRVECNKSERFRQVE